jgi:hypothetical protein
VLVTGGTSLFGYALRKQIVGQVERLVEREPCLEATQRIHAEHPERGGGELPHSARADALAEGESGVESRTSPSTRDRISST